MADIMRMVVDIGGTNARFALVPAGSLRPQDEKSVRCAEFPSLEDAARRYLRDLGNPVVQEAAIDVAVEPIGDFIQLTNGPWGFSIEGTRSALGLDRLQVVNDFTALALAVPTLRADELQSVGGGKAVAGTPIAVIGPGTGLGVSGLIPAGRLFVALQGEGGHTAFSPMDKRELGVLGWLLGKFDHVSTERVVSGMGLENLYQALCALDDISPQALGPDKITAAALAGTGAQRPWKCFAPSSGLRPPISWLRWVHEPVVTSEAASCRGWGNISRARPFARASKPKAGFPATSRPCRPM